MQLCDETWPTREQREEHEEEEHPYCEDCDRTFVSHSALRAVSADTPCAMQKSWAC